MSTKKYSYVFDAIAEDNLIDVFQYIHDKLCNPKAAFDLYNSFMQEIDLLRDFPDKGERRYEDIRRVLVENYWLYYIPLHEKECIYIVKIAHCTQKYANEFNGIND